MMEGNFYNDEFEQLIREKTEQYKMYPSEKVWKSIHGSLHTKRRWFISSMSVLVLGILLYAGRELILPSHNSLAKRSALLPSSSNAAPAEILDPDDEQETSVAGGAHHNTSSLSHHSGIAADSQNHKWVRISITDQTVHETDIATLVSQAVSLPAEAPALAITARPAASGVESGLNPGVDDRSMEDKTQGMANNSLVSGNNSPNNPITAAEAAGVREDAGTEAAVEAHVARTARAEHASKNTLASTRSGVAPVAANESVKAPASASGRNSIPFSDAIADEQKSNWLQDYAYYNLSLAPKKGRTYLQLYLTPMISYRSLSGGNMLTKSYEMLNIPVAPHAGEAKDFVDHNPAFGFEVGGMMQYRLTRNLTIKGGLQFNYSRYTIRAYTSNPQQATIALNSYYGYYLDSMTAISTIGNFGGKTPISINNDYYQLSAPLGFELRILGNERLQLNVGASVQPTYLLNTNSYMLTTDYTSYTKEPSLFRRWNVSGAVETFLTYTLNGGLRLQAGPEFRYQFMSTYDSQYPLHENLKGYGLKLGISKAIP